VRKPPISPGGPEPADGMPQAWESSETAMTAGAHLIPCARAEHTRTRSYPWHGDEQENSD
jgi:hypothetical protein